MSQQALDAKARKWNALQSKRFGSSRFVGDLAHFVSLWMDSHSLLVLGP